MNRLIDPNSSAFSWGVDVPCNFYGFQNTKNNQGNGYSNEYYYNNGSGSGKHNLYTALKMPLLASTKYQLSFMSL